MTATTFNQATERAARAAQVSPLKVLLTILMAPLWLLGFLVGVAWKCLVFVAVFLWAAIQIGFTAGGSKVRSPRPKVD